MQLDTLLSRVSDNLHVGRCFGPPIERDGCTVIPVALAAGGGGVGYGPTEGDGGAGWGGVARPLGVYEIRDGRVRWVPAIDLTRIVVALIALACVIVRRRRGR